MRRAFSVLLHTSFVMCAAARDFFGGAGSGWAVTAFLRRELEGQCRENGFGIGSWVLIKSDGFPLLVTSTSGMDALSELWGKSVDWLRFRPNIVIGGSDQAFAEDDWSRLMMIIGCIHQRGQTSALSRTTACRR